MIPFFSRRWWFATLLVLTGAAVCVRLGIWQLDRLEQRRAFNARVTAQINQPALALQGDALQADLYNMEYRPATAQGVYDFSQQVAILNQAHGGDWGVHLITPLIISGTQTAVMVDRGWIPAADYAAGDWAKYDEPGTVRVAGVLRRPVAKAELGGRSDPTPAPGEWIKAWNFVNIPAIQQQISLPLLDSYIQQAPSLEWSGMPYRSTPDVQITEGPHMGYAMQWFTFATILLVGYPFFIRRQERRGHSSSSLRTSNAP